MDCIIHAFPDEYHLATLENLLSSCASLHHKVDLKVIYINLMDRYPN